MGERGKKAQTLGLREVLRYWEMKTVIRGIGIALVALPAVAVIWLMFPSVGAGSGKDYQPGSDLQRLLSIHAREIVHSVPGVAALIIMGLGVVLIVVSVFVPD